MVSRRALLQVGGVLAAAGLSPALATQAARAAAAAPRTADAPLLPRFPAPSHLHFADISALPGEDQLLLTTLQGIVNRRRPELYFAYDTSGADIRWLPSLGVPVTRHDDGLALVARYRDRVRGAIVPDPDVPDSINVATTLAGLEDAVVADADRAKAHGLRVVRDLRGAFDTVGHDAASVYAWQREHLAPHCTGRLVAGLSPTRNVAVPGIQWHTIATETRQIRDSSNRKVYTLDLSPALGKDAVYLRFQDSFPGDGWGASVASVSVTANGAQIASFKPDTDGEKPYLFDGTSSAIGGDANRFADGGNYFIYRIPVPAGTTALSADVDLWNQFLVTAADTAPTRIEPFPNFRDYVVATRAQVFWLPPSGGPDGPFGKILSDYATTTPYCGWFPNDVAGEWDGTELVSRSGMEVVAADFYMNGTVHAGIPAEVSPTVPKRPRAKLKPTVYLTLTFGEGDNIQYCQRHMRELWDDPARGEAPANWTVSPLLADAGPDILAHYQRTATANDLLIAGPSGAGYTYLGSWPADKFDQYAELTGRYLRRTGMDLAYVYNTRGPDGWLPVPDAVGAALVRRTPLRGAILSYEKGDLIGKPGGLPVVGNFSPGGSPAEYRTALLAAVADRDPAKPAFVAGAVNAWQWTPTDVAALARLLKDDPVEIVRGDTFFALLAEAGGAGGA